LSIGTERRLARASDIEIPLDVVGRRSGGDHTVRTDETVKIASLPK
jgi:hypothetical protein